DARVMWDAQSGKTRGFGFVAYREKTDAEQAINTMNGEWIGTRAIRVNWANQKGAASSFHRAHPGQLSYESVVTRTPYYNTTVYLGNMAPQTTPDQVTSLLQQYGYIVNTRFQFDRGYAFIKMDTHENAAAAIATLNGTVLNGRPLKCSWGKDRPGDAVAAMAVTGGMTAPPPPYGMNPIAGGYGSPAAAGYPPVPPPHYAGAAGYGGGGYPPAGPAGAASPWGGAPGYPGGYPQAPPTAPPGANGAAGASGVSASGVAPGSMGHSMPPPHGSPYYGYEMHHPHAAQAAAPASLSAPPVHNPQYYSHHSADGSQSGKGDH
ncbi:E3 ubiquitin-protein ligase pub1, partial [Dimargaris cristalligena]